MALKYKCLILDHDDTAVKSTPDIHYPSFVEALKSLRPKEEPISLEDFIRYCFHPGFSSLCKDIIKFTDKELQHQQEIWKRYTETTVPDFYELFVETIQEFKKQGGIVTVVSHSERTRIERDYSIHCGFLPDAIFGWELQEHQRKPHPYPIKEILKRFNLKETEALMLDDLKPGLDMARSCQVDFAAAGWSHCIPEIKKQMKRESNYYFGTVEEFNKFILCK
ncbi:phosphoglycolate phosphatase/pyrophosphatase PpaX [Cytobacillus oceanisediminis]|uniref:Phosphoglycolate phosphatase/pyrophosphatase PpaX n=1 Tax=Cytobacillus oceanisediminis TaxID=665099 RepID=A0A2V2ZJT8_9BACI|nr:HAD hydrolase-like protein [Cytobacillus oceanisediminis]PWW20193.1 phosphoglycolate phosphatase/pyrophosphatase PpaX [Cytobacillus oceanisediminis]